MFDINKFIADDGIARRDPEGHVAGLAHWSPRLAAQIAAEECIALSEEHWQVIYCLRERYRLRGPDWTAREMTRELERDFSEAGGRRFLYALFPRGPLAQACRIAGLPLPHGTVSRSFGSVH